MRTGRRTKITEGRTEALLQGLRLGMTRRAACAISDMSPPTFYRAMDDDTFRNAVEKAEGEAESRFTALVARAAEDPKTWQAAAWWLERRLHGDFGRKDRIEMSVDLRKLAAEAGVDDMDPDAIVAEAEAIMAGQR